LNFNESLDLSPLFWQLAQQIEAEPSARRGVLFKQLQRIARDVKERQIALLEVVGTKRDGSLELDELAAAGPLIDADLNFPDLDPFAPEGQQVKRHFKVEVAEHDPANRRAWVRVSSNEKQWALWVDTFDFPLVNFTRISKSERFAIVLKRYDPPSAQVTFIYFPSWRSGVKDRPFIDEVISNLAHQQSDRGLFMNGPRGR
jgi:hypothetical protein